MRKLTIIAIAVTLLTWLVWPRPHQPKYTKLPATLSALGANVTLCEAAYDSKKQLKLRITIEHGITSDGVGDTDVRDRDGFINNGGSTSYSSGSKPGDPIKIECTPGLDRSPGLIDVWQQIHIHRPDRVVSLKLTDIGTRDMPAERAVKGCKIKLLRFWVNEIPGKRWNRSNIYDMNWDETRPCCGILLEKSLPDGFENEGTTLKDENGREIHIAAELANYEKDLTSSWEADKSTPAEAATELISPDKARQMKDKRAHQQPLQIYGAGHTRSLYVFSPTQPLPKRITVELKGNLPPEKKDTAILKFENVHVH